MLSQGCKPTKKAIENALIIDDLESVKIIIDSCPAFGINTEPGSLPFELMHGWFPLTTVAAKNNAVRCLRFLHEDNDDLSSVGRAALTPIAAAISNSALEAADFLIGNGAVPEEPFEQAAQSDCVDALEWVLSRYTKPTKSEVIAAHGNSVYLVRFDSVNFLEKHFPEYFTNDK